MLPGMTSKQGIGASWNGDGDGNCFSSVDMERRRRNVSDEPNRPPIVEEVDTLIAKDMFNLTLREREDALDDLHGIRKAEEDPNFVNSRLMELEISLAAIKHGSVYAEAEAQSESYVRNRHFRVMFLRAEYYDAQKAADRLLRFFALKKKLFGADKLVSNITLNDLSSDDMEALGSGSEQISRLKDVAGRPILISCHKLRKYATIENLRRAYFYVHMAAMESTVAQTKGIVGVYYLVDQRITASHNSDLRSSLPLVFGSLHLCLSDMASYVKACAAICTLSTKNRARYRMHYGSHLECLYDLISFGIPRNALPVSESGEWSLTNHLEWIEERKLNELSPQTQSANLVPAIERPIVALSPSLHGSPQHKPSALPELNGNTFEIRPTDVLFGREKAVVDHAGNVKFRHLIDIYITKYENAERLEKNCIAGAIVQMVQETNGRFLKKEGGSDWEEVDSAAARKKVAHAFRNRRKYHGYE